MLIFIHLLHNYCHDIRLYVNFKGEVWGRKHVNRIQSNSKRSSELRGWLKGGSLTPYNVFLQTHTHPHTRMSLARSQVASGGSSSQPADTTETKSFWHLNQLLEQIGGKDKNNPKDKQKWSGILMHWTHSTTFVDNKLGYCN